MAIRRNDGEKYSIYNVTLSTLRRPYDDNERRQLEQVLDGFVDHLASAEGYDEVFGSNGPNDRATIRTGRPEVGNDPRGSRVHIHFRAETLHAGLHRAPEIQERMREAFIEYAADHGVELSGAYAYVQVDNSSYMLNYQDKEVGNIPLRTQYIKRAEKELAAAKKKLKQQTK